MEKCNGIGTRKAAILLEEKDLKGGYFSKDNRSIVRSSNSIRDDGKTVKKTCGF